jgi:hypothetical protein
MSGKCHYQTRAAGEGRAAHLGDERRGLLPSLTEKFLSTVSADRGRAPQGSSRGVPVPWAAGRRQVDCC